MGKFIIPGETKKVIKHNDILVIVADGRCCKFYVLNADKNGYICILSTKHLGFYRKQIAESSLFDAHKKYVVNMEYITGYSPDYILDMKVYIGIAVRVSTRKVKAFKERLLN